jgi:hypothetical protein
MGAGCGCHVRQEIVAIGQGSLAHCKASCTCTFRFLVTKLKYKGGACLHLGYNYADGHFLLDLAYAVINHAGGLV